MSMGTTEQIAKALKSLRPNSEWSLSGEVYSGLIWIDTETSKPTEQQILDQIAGQ